MIKMKKPPLLVVWFSTYNPITPVHLFQKYYTHQLMWKCHFGKAEGEIRLRQHFFSQSNGTANNKDDMADSPDSQLLDFISQFF